MVSKLSSLAWLRSDSLKPGEIQRDEIRLVITDTTIICEAADPHAELERWKDSA